MKLTSRIFHLHKILVPLSVFLLMAVITKSKKDYGLFSFLTLSKQNIYI